MAIFMIILALILSLLLAYYLGISISKPIVSVANNMKKLASGDLSIQLDDKSENRADEIGILAKSLAETVQSIKGLTDETNALAEAAISGKLDVRIDATRHQGEYRKVVQGINETMDAVVGPLNMAADYIERIAQGETPPKITDEYNGDYNKIKEIGRAHV